MPSRSRRPVHASDRVRRAVVAILVVAVAVTALPAVAASRSSSDVVLVDQGAVIADDLYAAGNRVVVLGRVEGDLIATAFEDVLVEGTVTGDVLAVAGSVVVTGTVGESVRAVSPSIRVDGDVGGDVVTVGWATELTGDVGGDAVVWGWAAAVGGTIGSDLEGQTRRLRLGGTVEGDVDVTTTRLTATSDAVVAGDLGYRARRPGEGVELAEVGGTVVHLLPLAANVRVRALLVLAKVVLSLLAAVVGLLVIWAVPDAAGDAVDVVRRSWWRSWLRGAAFCLVPLAVVAIAAALLSVAPAAAAIPLLAVVAPVQVAAVGAVLALAFAAPAAAYPWLGRLGNSDRPRVRAFLLATGAVTVAVMVPWLVVVVGVGLVPVGMGGWLGPRRAG